MRKTKLIPLPNQVDEEEQRRRIRRRSNTNGSSGSSAPIQSATRGSSGENPVTMEDFLSFNRITFNASVPRPVSNPIHEERLRNSEPPLASSSQNIREVPIIRTDVEFSYLDEQQQQHHHHPPTAPSYDHIVPTTPPPTTMTIPRQLGRRSDQSPRIIAINAESNTIIIGDSHRPTSAPARVGLAAAAANEDIRRSMRDNNNSSGNGRGGEFDSMSSVASSRNPSPVSLISSSGSSMTSAHNGTQER